MNVRKFPKVVVVAGALSALVVACDDAASDAAAASGDAGAACAVFDGQGDVFVAATCPAASADGSRAHPFATLADALAAAESGDTVLLAAGEYPGDTQVTLAELTLVGAGPAATTLTGTLRFQGAVRARVGNLAISGAVGVGLQAREGAQVTAESVRVSGVTLDAEGHFGYGVAAFEGSSIILQNLEIDGCAGPGVVVGGGRLHLEASRVHDNAGGGVRVEAASGPSRVIGNTFENNAVLGLGVFSSRVEALGNHISGTRAVEGLFGDGIVVARLVGGASDAPAELRLGEACDADCEASANTVSGSARAGVVVHDSTAIILQNHVIENTRAGVWIQGGAERVRVEANEIARNGVVGVGLTGGSSGIILQNHIVDTRPGEIASGGQTAEVGDGVAVLDGSSGEIGGGEITGSFRAGIVLDAPGRVEISSLDLGEGPQGIILQNAPAPEVVRVPEALAARLETPALALPVDASALGLSADVVGP